MRVDAPRSVLAEALVQDLAVDAFSVVLSTVPSNSEHKSEIISTVPPHAKPKFRLSDPITAKMRRSLSSHLDILVRDRDKLVLALCASQDALKQYSVARQVLHRAWIGESHRTDAGKSASDFKGMTGLLASPQPPATPSRDVSFDDDTQGTMHTLLCCV